jgi:hypothetical protein
MRRQESRRPRNVGQKDHAPQASAPAVRASRQAASGDQAAPGAPNAPGEQAASGEQAAPDEERSWASRASPASTARRRRGERSKECESPGARAGIVMVRVEGLRQGLSWQERGSAGHSLYPAASLCFFGNRPRAGAPWLFRKAPMPRESKPDAALLRRRGWCRLCLPQSSGEGFTRGA